MYVTRCATLALLRPPVACLCADGNFCTIAPPNELAPSLIGCGIRPCLLATIPVFQLFDAPRADGTHPLTRSCASPKELIDESDVLPPLWSVFPLTAARGLPQKLHTLLGLCLRVAKAKLECCVNHAELSGALFCSGPSLASMAAQLLPTTLCFPFPRDAPGPRRPGPARPTTAFSKGRHPSNRWLCESTFPSVVLG